MKVVLPVPRGREMIKEMSIDTRTRKLLFVWLYEVSQEMNSSPPSAESALFEHMAV